MSVDQVQTISKTNGRKLIPSLSDYDGVSESWSEAEYRADLTGTESVAGFWEGDVGWVSFDSWPYNEVCVLITGRVAIEDEHGERREFGAGDAFLVPAGFRGTWHTLEKTEKVFVGVTADSAGGLDETRPEPATG